MQDGRLRADNMPVWDGRQRGHYEVWYLKLNLVPQGLAFWFRYTITSPLAERGEPTVTQLWAIAFDAADPSRNQAFRETFSPEPGLPGDPLSGRIIRIGPGELKHDGCSGALGDGGEQQGISWELSFSPEGEPFRHFPSGLLYRLPLPKTKVLAPHLAMRVRGEVRWRGRTIRFDDAPGHQAHIWGSQHAERWAWANCTDFPGLRGAALELLSARIALGGRLSPDLTLGLLRLPERSIELNQLRGWLLHHSHYSVAGWHLRATRGRDRVDVWIDNKVEQTVGVTYRDPDGSTRVCHNSKLADARVDLYRRSWGSWRHELRLESAGRAAFEVVQRQAAPEVRLLLP